MRGRRGQMIIVVIVAIVIVATVVLFFMLSGRGIDVVEQQGFDDPESFIDQCVRESLRDNINQMTLQGGFANPTDYKTYNDITVPYLCKTIHFYEPCITQYPLYISTLQEEVSTVLQEDIESCFILLEEELDQRNYAYSGGEITLETTLKPGTVEITVLRDFTFTRNGVTRNFNSFTVAVKSAFYDLAWIANEIAAQEAKFCNFEYLGFMALYPEFDARKFTMSDSTKIYSVTHKASGDTMHIATRGCAIPAGF